jgi:hypothetical protein
MRSNHRLIFALLLGTGLITNFQKANATGGRNVTRQALKGNKESICEYEGKSQVIRTVKSESINLILK